MWRTLSTAAVVAALWLVGVGSALVPVPLGGTHVALVGSAILWLGIIGGCLLAGVLARRGWVGLVGALGAVLLCVPLFNWSRVASRTWFDVHRSFYEAALDDVDTGSDEYYGDRLPARYSWLTVDGRAVPHPMRGERDVPESVFFPQWYGIPDDGGGYIWSPDGSPEGMDMAGARCHDPVDLGDGWWMCGMD